MNSVVLKDLVLELYKLTVKACTIELHCYEAGNAADLLVTIVAQYYKHIKNQQGARSQITVPMRS